MIVSCFLPVGLFVFAFERFAEKRPRFEFPFASSLRRKLQAFSKMFYFSPVENQKPTNQPRQFDYQHPFPSPYQSIQ
jgi:hypothetical protein